MSKYNKKTIRRPVALWIKILLIIGVVAIAFLFNFVITVVEVPLHYRLASDTSIHGKGKDSECMDYAIALSSRLAAHGIHGRLIFYHWHIRSTGVSGDHVMVVYHLEDNSYWIVDNEIPHPKQVSADATNMELIWKLSDNRGKGDVDVEINEAFSRMGFF
jgi:hypothetical protein